MYSDQDKPTAADIGALSLNELVGVPMPWPQAMAPSGWLKCNGQTFDKNIYPRLSQVYPAGLLPDLRGEFIRGWDDGRGVDKNRELFSWQEDDLKSHSHTLSGGGGYEGGPFADTTAQLDVQTVNTGTTGGVETRPRNISFNYIVRAA
ncbi:hypothetical protein AKG38_12935 [Pectobacterium carotovorum subsp. carotovorum]|nr:hypothetical protein [Pectobacterium carotovorum subsp. carotovorum]